MLTDAELLEKIFFAFHASNLILRQFAIYFELISMLLTVERTNELLLKNHDLRHASSKALPEAYANSMTNFSRFKGYDRRQENYHHRSGRKFNGPRKANFGLNHDKGKKEMKLENERKLVNDSVCYRCDIIGHWLHTCRTPKYLVDLYQASAKKKGERGKSHAIEIKPTAKTNNTFVGGTPHAPEVSNTSLDVTDFFEDLQMI
ncbi:uncharacterized protein LOC133306639 [Gastrolobium bilobum]|uniref:uncharacterized protein LOC133306639 n=1 Tax=Gastrolobium bilobum TaxID=150636 RepID=UPI002AB158C6|nr:uncharacterized protein LOC133306639 [Gastrolobium bilobum]